MKISQLVTLGFTIYMIALTCLTSSASSIETEGETTNETLMFQGHEYKIVLENKSLPKAHYFCRKLGGFLTDIDEETESFLTKKMPGPAFAFWIGLFWSKSLSDWYWSNGAPHNYSKLGNKSEESGCIDLVWDGNEFEWNQINCSEEKPSICKIIVSGHVKEEEGGDWTKRLFSIESKLDFILTLVLWGVLGVSLFTNMVMSCVLCCKNQKKYRLEGDKSENKNGDMGETGDGRLKRGKGTPEGPPKMVENDGNNFEENFYTEASGKTGANYECVDEGDKVAGKTEETENVYEDTDNDVVPLTTQASVPGEQYTQVNLDAKQIKKGDDSGPAKDVPDSKTGDKDFTRLNRGNSQAHTDNTENVYGLESASSPMPVEGTPSQSENDDKRKSQQTKNDQDDVKKKDLDNSDNVDSSFTRLNRGNNQGHPDNAENVYGLESASAPMSAKETLVTKT